MCIEPGVLLCLDELNDCNGHGDCFKGSCMCFVGWGGLDCSVPICEGQCDDVRLCLVTCIAGLRPAVAFVGDAFCCAADHPCDRNLRRP